MHFLSAASTAASTLKFHMADIPLVVIPGLTWQPETPVDHARLNQTANPVVKIPDGAGIGPPHLDMDAILQDAGDSLRGVNYLTRPNFWYEDFREGGDAHSCPVDVWTENALDWFAKPTGAPIIYQRLEDAPDTNSDHCAQLIGAASVTSVDFAGWLPAAIAGSLRGATQLTFSIQVKNLTGATAALVPFVFTADGRDSKTTMTEVFTGPAINVLANAWTRVSFTVDASTLGNFRNGAFFGLRTTALTTNLKSLQFAQAQLEVGAVATTFIRPQLPAVPSGEGNAILPLADADRAQPWQITLTRNDGTETRFLPSPPASWIKPRIGYNKTTGIPEWMEDGANKLVFYYTGGDQTLTIPTGVTSMTVKAWGAGGSNDGGLAGGCGGYCMGTIAVTAGQVYRIVVGRGVLAFTGRPYGFAGAGQGTAHQVNGGGLSGIFSGAGAVLATDAARALIIAGGGGAGGGSTSPAQNIQGGNGGDPTRSGGMPNFQGADATGTLFVGNGGGGGGYNGGSGLGLGGNGGTNFIAGTVTSPTNSYTAYPSLIVPGSTDVDYLPEVGQPNKSGLIVVTFS
jgi:hypothetical protein